MRVALATCMNLPEPDPDQPLLLDALAARGLTPTMMAWDDPSADWSSVRACVIRSTWNYYRAIDRFMAWAERTARVTTLWNPLSIVRWNVDKRYLQSLEKKGVPIVPTRFVGRDEATSLRDVMRELSAEVVVVKPAISAASFATVKVDEGEASRAAGEAHLRELVARGDVLVQPYVPSVERYGERSLIWIDGAMTHAIRKSPRFGGEHENVSAAMPIADDERALAERALETIAEPLLYARIDLARDERGGPMIMELELLEPSLFLAQHPPALDRFADAIARRCAP